MIQPPTVVLDTTIADLYRQAGPKYRDKHIGYVGSASNSIIKLSKTFPRNLKFIYQDSLLSTMSCHKLCEKDLQLQRSLAVKYLAVMSQREAFLAGNTIVFLFNLGQSADQKRHDRQEVDKTLSVLRSNQKPQIVFCANPREIDMKEHRIDVLACRFALDGMEPFPVTYDLERSWLLNSKEALATSGLPTPKCDIIELEGYYPEAQACCTDCRDGEFLIMSPERFDQQRRWMNKAMANVVSMLEKRQLPFVVKSQQAYAGAGTWIIDNEAKREEVIQFFSQGFFRRLLSQVTRHNQHLKPASILLSDMIVDPIANYALSFFVCEDGTPVFLGVCEQLLDSESVWLGGTITYSAQNQLEEEFGPCMKQIASWLHTREYFGPCGADILVTEHGKMPTDYHIIDANVRTPGSLCLCLMRTHFSSRGLDTASFICVKMKASRSSFLESWAREIKRGQICIIAFYEDESSGMSLAELVIAGKDARDLTELVAEVQAASKASVL